MFTIRRRAVEAPAASNPHPSFKRVDRAALHVQRYEVIDAAEEALSPLQFTVEIKGEPVSVDMSSEVLGSGCMKKAFFVSPGSLALWL